MAETGEAAADAMVKIDVGMREYKGSLALQKAYFEKVLALAEARRFKFVIAWFYHDPIAVERYFWAPWQNCGFVDKSGATRPAYAVWQKYFQMPLREQ